MNTKNIRTLLITTTLVAVLFITFSLVSRPDMPADGKGNFNLIAPPFVGVAEAETNYAALSIGEQLDTEAGISAYFKSPNTITLSQVRGQFRTIETETADYIIGSVAVPNYPENFDAHVYVHKNGWILAYYLRSDPTSKIIDVKGQTVNTTKLKTVVAAVASAGGAAFTDVTYYDFRYPNATNMIFVAENFDNGNSFTIQLPSSFGYYERGWALYNDIGGYSIFKLDGVDIHNTATWQGSSGDYLAYGILTASQLLPDTLHTIEVGRYGVLAITYRIP